VNNDIKWLVAAIAVGVVSVVIGKTVMNHQDNQAMTEMVKGGADPIQAACAVRSLDCKLFYPPRPALSASSPK
jgi:hypothetical protein